ncbi:MAG: hypothetical protein AAGG54_03710 [Pseudomonadota bacterium]
MPRVCHLRSLTKGVAATCGIGLFRVEGQGIRPVAIDIEQPTDGAGEANAPTFAASPTQPDQGWHTQINFNANNEIACNPGTCVASRYAIRTINPAPITV